MTMTTKTLTLTPKMAEDIMRAWYRVGAREAWEVACLYAGQDTQIAARLVVQLDELEHVRNGILSRCGRTVADLS
jgi:hypothetical protein